MSDGAAHDELNQRTATGCIRSVQELSPSGANTYWRRKLCKVLKHNWYRAEKTEISVRDEQRGDDGESSPLPEMLYLSLEGQAVVVIQHRWDETSDMLDGSPNETHSMPRLPGSCSIGWRMP